MPARTGTFSAELKPRQAKLLRCRLTLHDDVIVTVRFTGDFFLMPGDAMKKLEEELKGTSVDKMASRITEFFSRSNIEMLGVSPEHFIAVMETALAKS